MHGKKWTLIALIVLLIGSWTAESRSRFEWLESSDPGEPNKDADVIADMEEAEDSEDFELRGDRFGREISIPRGKGTETKSPTKVNPNPAPTSSYTSTIERDESAEQSNISSMIFLLLLFLCLSISVSACCVCYFLKPNPKDNYTPISDETSLSHAKVINAPDTGKNPAKKEDKSLEEPSPPVVKTEASVKKMRAKLLETQANLDKLRAHVKRVNAQHKSDTRTSKFQKKGPIFIPREPPIPPAAILPDNIVLEKVTYDPENNEMWEVGSDVDDIELDDSFRLNPDSLSETEDETSRKSGSKKSKKSKKNDPKDKKTGGTDDPKTPKENETPAPAPTAPPAPPAPTTAPAPEPSKDAGKTADAKEKKENKSVEQDKSKKN